jgi:hypothetical protein
MREASTEAKFSSSYVAYTRIAVHCFGELVLIFATLHACMPSSHPRTTVSSGGNARQERIGRVSQIQIRIYY